MQLLFISSFSERKKKRDHVKSIHQLHPAFSSQNYLQVKNMHRIIKKYGILTQRSSSINHFKRLKQNGFSRMEDITDKRQPDRVKDKAGKYISDVQGKYQGYWKPCL